MKFRGRLTDLTSIRKFYSVLGTMAKLSKVCVMRLTKDKMFLILTESNGGGGAANRTTMTGGGPTVWGELNIQHFFRQETRSKPRDVS